MTTQATVIAILANTPQETLDGFLTQRNPGPDAESGVFVEAQTVDSLAEANWKPCYHPAVRAPAKAFKAPIGGYVGVVAVEALNPDAELTLVYQEEAGSYELAYSAENGPATEFTTMIVGPDKEDTTKLVVWTLFPGNPGGPSMVKPPTDGQVSGDVITVETARELGYGSKFAKVVADA